jgi:deoxyadenosine/deoxycytidine kinase
VKKGNPAICDDVKESISEHKLLSLDTNPDKLPTDIKLTWAETLILSVLNHRPKSKRKPTIMSIEGIPGCGKSTTIDDLNSAYADHPDVIILTEPVHEWESIRVRDLSLMDLANRYPLKAGFAFQLFYFLVTERQLKRALREHSQARVILSERSLISARHVYMKILGSYVNKVEHAVYNLLFEREGVRQVLPNHIVFMNTEPTKCLGKRSRYDGTGGELITKEYLDKCHRYHSKLQGKCTSEFSAIYSEPDKLKETQMKIAAMIDNQNSQEETEVQIVHFEPDKPVIISIEGNVGAGKSTLLRALKDRIVREGIDDIMVLEEPVDEWKLVNDGTHNILELFYLNPKKYALVFQTLVTLTTIKKLQEIRRENPEIRVIVCERSLLSSQKIFAENLVVEGILAEYEYEVYQELFREQEIEWMYPRETIYLDTDPKICLQRIRDRNREGEQKIDLEWLHKCQGNHEEFFRHSKPKILKGNNTDIESRQGWISTILGWCDSLKESILKVPDTNNLDLRSQLGGVKVNQEGKFKPIEDTLGHNDERNNDIGMEEELPIKLKYMSRNQYVIMESYSFEELVKLAYEAFPEVREKEIEGFTWKVEIGGVVGMIYGDSELKFAINSMIAWERPVIRLEIICIEEEDQSDGMAMIPDEENDLRRSEYHC